MDLRDKKIVIVGAGRSGLAAARYARDAGAKVLVNDHRKENDLGDTLELLRKLDVTLVLGSHREEDFVDADLIVLSPGVPTDLPCLQAARARDIPVWGELELASQLTERPIIAVTGTNGKSTTATLIHEMLRASGQRTALGGNIGTPFLDLVRQNKPYDAFVIEVSSYQLESIEQFHPHIAILLNLSPDHLGRHPSMDDYADAKSRLFMNQTDDDWTVFNADDPWVKRAVANSQGRPVSWSQRRPLSEGLFKKDGRIIWFSKTSQESYDLSDFALRGTHNIENAMAAIAGARLAGAEVDAIQETLETFHGLAHRFEQVGVYRNITFINDSKATNVGATVRALDGISKGHLILLAGGEDKGSSYAPLSEALRDCEPRGVVVFGQAADKLRHALSSSAPLEQVGTLEEAFHKALSLAHAGDTVLLSPACASFDQFRNFEERGNRFRELFTEVTESKQVGT